MSSVPFLTIFTRHMVCRPGLYAGCLESLAAQTCRDFEHVVAVDDVGRGFAFANAQFEAHREQVTGDYVLQLDDDDVLFTPDAVGALKALAEMSCPDVIVFKGDHLELGILPDTAVWGKRPICGHIGGEDFIVKRELWLRCLPALRSARYAADYDFMAAIWREKPSVHWFDRVLVRCQRISRGRAE